MCGHAVWLDGHVERAAVRGPTQARDIAGHAQDRFDCMTRPSVLCAVAYRSRSSACHHVVTLATIWRS